MTSHPLTFELCQANAVECRKLVPQTDLVAAQVMLRHIAETWERIAARIKEAEG
jgi:hypothetical protein